MKNFFLGLLLVGVSFGDEVIKSPDGKVAVTLSLKDGLPHWSATVDGAPVLKPGAINIYQGDKATKPFKYETEKVERAEVNKTWKPTWGQFSSVKNHYHEATWLLTGPKANDTKLKVRVYDEGFALRYLVKKPTGKIGDRTIFNFASDDTFWAANKEKPNHGPMKFSAWEQKKRMQMPMTVKGQNGLHYAVLEAAIYHQYPFFLNRIGATTFETRTYQTKWAFDEAASSWRVLSVGRSAGDLIESNLLWNLNPESQIKDTSWIKPGYTLWDWRAWGAKAPDGFEYGLDMASWRRFIDFAAKHDKVHYLMLDANWYGPEFLAESNPTKSRDHILEQLPDGEIVRKEAPADWAEPIDVPAIIKYGNERGVGIILYINDKARVNFDFDKTLETYAKWGAAGIKYGFMATKGDAKVQATRKIVQACAKHKLICDFHDGPIPGSGDERTWPNYITREFCHAQSDAKRAFSPDHFVTTVFNNGLTGSLDMANGLYAIKDAEKVRPRIFKKVETTVVAETARTLISYAALAILPDIPEAYEAKADLFKFIETMPMTWDDTKVLSGEIGKHISVARRSGDQWWIASVKDKNGGQMELDFSFLPEGSSWEATLYEDAPDTHYQTNPETYLVRKAEISAGQKLTITLAPGGGHCISLKKK